MTSNNSELVKENEAFFNNIVNTGIFITYFQCIVGKIKT